MSGWISVKDRMPEDGQVTLCFEPRKGNIFVSQFSAPEYCVPHPFKGGWTDEYYEKSPTTDGCMGGYGYWPFVSHWMPLPAPPQ